MNKKVHHLLHFMKYVFDSIFVFDSIPVLGIVSGNNNHLNILLRGSSATVLLNPT